MVIDMESAADSGTTNLRNRSRVVVACEWAPVQAGAQSGIDIIETSGHRPWHQDATYSWDGQALILQAENDFDDDFVALMDEFFDAIAACVGDLVEASTRAVSTASDPAIHLHTQ